jgi:hypothetical protein
MSRFREVVRAAIGEARRRSRFNKTASTVGCYWDDRHVILFKRRVPSGPGSAWGIHIRVRLRNREWHHTVARFFEKSRPIPGGRGAWKCEVLQYKTEGVSGSSRTSIKRFLRVKWGLGPLARHSPDARVEGSAED